MPPIYDYLCKDCGLKTTVVRTVADMAVLPGEMEGENALKDQLCTHGEKKHVWEKQFGSFSVSKGRNWGPGKGHW